MVRCVALHCVASRCDVDVFVPCAPPTIIESHALGLDLEHLERLFDANGWSYAALFDQLQDIVAVSMRRLDAQQRQQEVEREGFDDNDDVHGNFGLQLPKILGFDVLLEAAAGTEQPRPWLIEINRSPGLSPRGPEDRRVKTSVVQGAWRIAAEIAFGDSLGNEIFGDIGNGGDIEGGVGLVGGADPLVPGTDVRCTGARTDRGGLPSFVRVDVAT